MSIKCEKCGSKGNGKFCSVCGTLLPEQKEEMASDAEIAGLKNQLDGIIYVLKESQSFDPQELRKKAGIDKFSEENLDIIYSIPEIQKLIAEAKDPNSPQSKEVIQRLKGRYDWLIDYHNKIEPKRTTGTVCIGDNAYSYNPQYIKTALMECEYIKKNKLTPAPFSDDMINHDLWEQTNNGSAYAELQIPLNKGTELICYAIVKLKPYQDQMTEISGEVRFEKAQRI